MDIKDFDYDIYKYAEAIEYKEDYKDEEIKVIYKIKDYGKALKSGINPSGIICTTYDGKFIGYATDKSIDRDIKNIEDIENERFGGFDSLSEGHVSPFPHKCKDGRIWYISDGMIWKIMQYYRKSFEEITRDEIHKVCEIERKRIEDEDEFIRKTKEKVKYRKIRCIGYKYK